VIEHEGSASQSGSQDRSAERQVRRRRSSRQFALGCLAIVIVLAGVFWRQVAILWCWGAARVASEPTTIAWNEAALGELGPQAIPALARLADRPEIQHAYSAGVALHLMRAQPDANAPLHDLLLYASPRVRAAAAIALLAADEKDALARQAVVEGLESPDADVRLFCALATSMAHLAGEDRRVRELMLKDLTEGAEDPRDIFSHEAIRGFKVDGQRRVLKDCARARLLLDTERR
jgi:hypothetical protein